MLTNERGGWPPDPLKTQYRIATGGYPAVTMARASGDLDPETQEMLRSINALPANQRADALAAFMRARQASDDSIRTAVAALGQGGLGALTQHLTNTGAAERARIEQAGQTERTRIEQETRLELQRLQNEAAAARGYVDSSLQTMPSSTMAPTPAPAAPMSTGTKVAIGVGVGALVLLAGYAVYSSQQQAREPYGRGR